MHCAISGDRLPSIENVMKSDELIVDPYQLALAIRRKGMDALARREHSHKELLQKLSQKGYPEEAVSDVLQELEDDGLLSDERFAEAYVNARRNKGYGPVRIQVELRERGVAAQLVEHFLYQDEFDWFALAEQVYRKRFGTDVPTELKEKQRCMRFMQYRGFTTEHIKACLNDE